MIKPNSPDITKEPAKPISVSPDATINMAYPDDLYAHDGLGEILPNPQAFDHKAIQQFKLEGYLSVADVYTTEQVENAKLALDDLIARRYKKLTGLQLEGSAKAKADGSTPPDPTTMFTVVRKLDDFTQEDPRLAVILEHPALIHIVEQLAGEKTVKIQEMALLKPPQGREKPWHQDHAYFNSDNSKHIVGVWIALDEATIANGCMHVLPGKHHEPVIHFSRRDWQICDTTTLAIKQKCLAIPLKPGSVLFFDSFLPHGTPTNNTNQRRRAIQLHFKPATAGDIETQDRMLVWGSEGKDVEC